MVILGHLLHLRGFCLDRLCRLLAGARGVRRDIAFRPSGLVWGWLWDVRHARLAWHLCVVIVWWALGLR